MFLNSSKLDLLKFSQSLDNSEKLLLSEVLVLAILLIVTPATDTVSGRSFSALKRVKTYLRATTPDARLNNSMVLHVHKKETDNIDMVDAANRFVAVMIAVAVFLVDLPLADIAPKALLKSTATQTLVVEKMEE